VTDKQLIVYVVLTFSNWRMWSLSCATLFFRAVTQHSQACFRWKSQTRTLLSAQVKCIMPCSECKCARQTQFGVTHTLWHYNNAQQRLQLSVDLAERIAKPD